MKSLTPNTKIERPYLFYLGLGAIICAFVCVVCALVLLIAPLHATALDEAPYTPGENYVIDEPEAFLDQDISHEEAQENRGSTEYYLTCPFYLIWTSDDMTVFAGEDASIGCYATGLEPLSYHWLRSDDGGLTWNETDLLEREHTLVSMKMNSPEDEPYLYKCIITNGDDLSTLETTVKIKVVAPPANLAKTSDNAFAPLILLGTVAVCALAIFVLRRRHDKKDS